MLQEWLDDVELNVLPGLTPKPTGCPPLVVGSPAVANVAPASPNALRCGCASNWMPNDPLMDDVPLRVTLGVYPVDVDRECEYAYSNRGLKYVRTASHLET